MLKLKDIEYSEVLNQDNCAFAKGGFTFDGIKDFNNSKVFEEEIFRVNIRDQLSFFSFDEDDKPEEKDPCKNSSCKYFLRESKYDKNKCVIHGGEIFCPKKWVRTRVPND
ncbi:hypothetical protein [Moorena sp. SIO3H5]|uniref:hypothetical protein n=1 Tax=Moorena sp. SIO3H5 TaxID=2607834 RepID=UPI0013B78D10|nr:hypothetical protein [Moorena sp. SIO3H5]NEO71137.1 hypothetical protein [Moorena sp. SIO3H5]